MGVESYNGFAVLAVPCDLCDPSLYRNERKVFAGGAKASQLGLYKRTSLHHTFENGENA